MKVKFIERSCCVDIDLPSASENNQSNWCGNVFVGNNHMKEENYRCAVECYTKAIDLDLRNAVYYCNRYLQQAEDTFSFKAHI